MARNQKRRPTASNPKSAFPRIDQMQAVAAMAYTEMLKRGYTHVAEFQYLHHDKNGKPYNNNAEMSVSLLAAAAIAGIKITLIPVYYQKGGFGKQAEPAQRRFCFRNGESSSARSCRDIPPVRLPPSSPASSAPPPSSPTPS